MSTMSPIAAAGTITANKELVRRYLAEVVSGDARRAADYVAADIIFTSPYTARPIEGIAGFQAMIAGLREGFPDLVIAEEEVLAEGDLVASRWTATGTNTGPFAGAPPTGNRIAITGMSIYRIRAGRIVEGWVNDDTLAMAQQLGVRAGPGET